MEGREGWVVGVRDAGGLQNSTRTFWYLSSMSPDLLELSGTSAVLSAVHTEGRCNDELRVLVNR